MENLINSIIELDDDEKYIVLNQAVYQGNNYYFVGKVTPEEDDVLDEFKLLQEVDINGTRGVQLVTDEKIITLLTKYFKPKD